MFTLKQKSFLEAGNMEFEKVYSAFYHRYEDLQGKGMLETVKHSMSRYFEIGRIDKLLGGQTHSEAPESSGVGRTLAAGAFFRRDVKIRKAEKKQTKELKEMTPITDFFGAPDEAKDFFSKVLAYLSERFKFAIEMLANDQKGTTCFARYIVYRSFLVLKENPGVITRMGNEKEKLNYLVQQIILYVPKDNIPEAFQSLKREKDIHSKKVLSPTALLCKSPILLNGSIFCYTGHEPHGQIQLPFQHIKHEQEMSAQHYERSTIFSIKKGV